MLTQWDPFTEMQHLQDRLSRLAGRSQGQGQGALFVPPVDIYETDETITIRAELAGVKSDDVHITVENNVLTLRGERRFEQEESRGGYHRVETSYGAFARSFVLPSSVDNDNIQASMDNGILTLSLPKKSVAKPRSIGVKTGSQVLEGKQAAAREGDVATTAGGAQAGAQAGSPAQAQGASQQQQQAGEGGNGRRAQASTSTHQQR